MASKRVVRVGSIALGAGNPVVVQSMLCAAPEDVEGNLRQARELHTAGCEIIRLAIPSLQACKLIPLLKQATPMPVVADIHFDYKLALAAIEAGADKIRINPGNLGGAEKLRQVAQACGQAGVPIRVGVNSGSLEQDLLETHGGPTGQALAESALRGVHQLEELGFYDIVVSVKSSRVAAMVQACRILDAKCPYPQHLGVTEAGTPRMGIVKSAVGLGGLLLDGIGDTIRVSLTANPVEEIAAALDILQAAGCRQPRLQIISCPTCGRCKIDVIALAQALEERLAGCTKPLTLAVMGCAVNGPGEAREADLGIAGGEGEALLFCKGKPVCKLPAENLLERIVQEVEHFGENE